MYVDGKVVSQGTYQTPPEFQAETKLYVGSAFASGAPASPAQITGLRVVNRDAGAGEIGEQFHAGAPPARQIHHHSRRLFRGRRNPRTGPP